MARQPAVTRELLKQMSATRGEMFFNEGHLQRFFENRLVEVGNYRVIASATRGGRRLFDVDTLALDAELRPIIIEYKRNEADSVVTTQMARYQRSVATNEAAIRERCDELALGLNWALPRMAVVAYRFDPEFAAEAVRSGIQLVRFSYVVRDGVAKVVFGEARLNGLGTQESHPETPGTQYLQKYMDGTTALARQAFAEVRSRLCELGPMTVDVLGKRTVSYKAGRNNRVFARVRFEATGLIWAFPKEVALPTTLKRPSKAKSASRCGLNGPADVESVFRLLKQSYDRLQA